MAREIRRDREREACRPPWREGDRERGQAGRLECMGREETGEGRR